MMSALLRFDGIELWHVAGWTMLHFLWLGTLVALAAGVSRLALRRVSASVRYMAALMFFAMVAAAPFVIAVWLASQAPSVSADLSSAAANVPTQVQPFGQAAPRAGPDMEVPTYSVPLTSAPAREAGGVEDPSGRLVPPLAAPAFAAAMLESSARYLPWLWIVGTPITFALLATGIVGAERLRRSSLAINEGAIADACRRLATSLRITRRVTVAVCERVAAPVLVGIVRPMILLPPAALTGWSPDEIEMVLLHELAHVRRWDNLVNLVQRLVESLLFFHPAVWWISGWIRREREAYCDAVVVGQTNRPHAYAEMLVALAAEMPRSVLFYPAASSAMAARPLRSRICRILQLEDDPMLISGKSLTLVLGSLALMVTLMVLYLPASGKAEQSTDATGELATEKPEPQPAVEHHRQIEMTTSSGEHVLAESQDGRLRVQIRSRRTGKFPSLEEQKLADLAWKRLGLELELIGDDDLQRVKALGYDGGVKVTGFQFGRYGVGEDGIESNDILVGLHAWPTTSLQAVAEVLNRDDLEELNPLKYYVVRPGRTYRGGRMTPGMADDRVLTGRIVAGPLPTVTGPVSPVGSSMEVVVPMPRPETGQLQDAFQAPQIEFSRSQHQAEARIAEAAKHLGEVHRQQALMEQQLADLQSEATADLSEVRKHELALQAEQLRQQIGKLGKEAAKQTRAIQKQAEEFQQNTERLKRKVKEQQRQAEEYQRQANEYLRFSDALPQRRVNRSEPVTPEAEPRWRASLSLPYTVRFEQGASRFLDGDQVTVLEIRGTAETFKPGNIYWIRGTYTLGSHDRAQLAAFTTARQAADGKSKIWTIQTIDVDRGSGTFELFLPMSHEGWPHVSYYPAGGGNGFGGTYFGTGDSVLKNWSEVYGGRDQTQDYSRSNVGNRGLVPNAPSVPPIPTAPAAAASQSAPQSSAQPDAAPEPQPTPPTIPSSLPYVVRFEQGASRFLDGDNIRVLEIRGTARTIKPDNFYWIKGIYRLGSHDQAELDVYVTPKVAAKGGSPPWRIQTSKVKRGEGTFELFLPVTCRGWPHVSFYPADGGTGFGGTHFGTGDSVLKNWSTVYGPTDDSTPTPVAGEDLFGAAEIPTAPMPQQNADSQSDQVRQQIEAIHQQIQQMRQMREELERRMEELIEEAKSEAAQDQSPR